MKIADKIQGVTTKADAEAVLNSEKNKEIAEKTFKGRMVKPMKSKEEVNTKLELNEAWFQDLDPDEEIIDMFTFINSLFTRGESGYHMPKNPLGRRYNHFEYRDRDGDANDVSPVGSNSNGDVVLLAETREEFDDAKEICDKYDFTYQIKPYRGQYFKHQMIINVPEDLDGNPMDVKTYFDDLGMNLEDVMPVTGAMKNSIKKQMKAKNESYADRKAVKNVRDLTKADLEEDPGFLYYVNPSDEALPILMDNVIIDVNKDGVIIEGSPFGGMIGGLHKLFIPFEAFDKGLYTMAVAD